MPQQADCTQTKKTKIPLSSSLLPLVSLKLVAYQESSRLRGVYFSPSSWLTLSCIGCHFMGVKLVIILFYTNLLVEHDFP